MSGTFYCITSPPALQAALLPVLGSTHFFSLPNWQQEIPHQERFATQQQHWSSSKTQLPLLNESQEVAERGQDVLRGYL